jgi:hypothetical protein
MAVDWRSVRNEALARLSHSQDTARRLVDGRSQPLKARGGLTDSFAWQADAPACLHGRLKRSRGAI